LALTAGHLVSSCWSCCCDGHSIG